MDIVKSDKTKKRELNKYLVYNLCALTICTNFLTTSEKR